MLRDTVYCYWLSVLLPYMWHVEEYSSLLPGVSLPYMWHISTNLVYSYPTCGMLRDTMYCYWLSVVLSYMWHVEGCSVLLLAYCTIALHVAC